MQPYTLAGIGGYRCIDHPLVLKCAKFISRTEAESYYAMTMVKTSRIQVFVEPLALNLASVDEPLDSFPPAAMVGKSGSIGERPQS